MNYKRNPTGILHLIFFSIFIFGYTTAITQPKSNTRNQTRIFTADSLFRCYGVIFDSNYKIPFRVQGIKGRFTPDETDIVIAERVLFDQYNTVITYSKTEGNTDSVVDVKKHFYNFNRQYIGYFDEQGKRNLIIQLFDYRKKRAIKKYIGDSWKTDFIILFSERMPFDINTYRVNLSKQQLYASW